MRYHTSILFVVNFFVLIGFALVGIAKSDAQVFGADAPSKTNRTFNKPKEKSPVQMKFRFCEKVAQGKPQTLFVKKLQLSKTGIKKTLIKLRTGEIMLLTVQTTEGVSAALKPTITTDFKLFEYANRKKGKHVMGGKIIASDQSTCRMIVSNNTGYELEVDFTSGQ